MISEDRKKHIFGVANFLKNYAISKNMKQEDIEALFTLGLLHDIGYEFLEEKDYFKHNFVGGMFLMRQGYKYWKEVYYHGEPNCTYSSEFLDLLNWADNRIDSKGREVSFEERLEDVSKRYNTPIKETKNYQIICQLKAKGFK